MRLTAYIIGVVIICGPFSALMALNVDVKTMIDVKSHNEDESREGVSIPAESALTSSIPGIQGYSSKYRMLQVQQPQVPQPQVPQ